MEEFKGFTKNNPLAPLDSAEHKLPVDVCARGRQERGAKGFTLAEVTETNLPLPMGEVDAKQTERAFTPSDTTCHLPQRGRKCGFTLAEVLITLGVIGVVAAITIPSVITHYKEKQTITQLKKTYSILGQAFQRITAEYGTADNWDLSDANSFRDLFANYLKYIKKCDSGVSGCEPEHVYWLNNREIGNYSTHTNYSHLILNDGTILVFYFNPITYDKTCSENLDVINDLCSGITIHTDINNFKSPNIWGKDRFQFRITKTKIVPTGTEQTKFENDCLNSNGLGENCSGWVLINENLDYLHCNDLSWNGKTKCK